MGSGPGKYVQRVNRRNGAHNRQPVQGLYKAVRLHPAIQECVFELRTAMSGRKGILNGVCCLSVCVFQCGMGYMHWPRTRSRRATRNKPWPVLWLSGLGAGLVAGRSRIRLPDRLGQPRRCEPTMAPCTPFVHDDRPLVHWCGALCRCFAAPGVLQVRDNT